MILRLTLTTACAVAALAAAGSASAQNALTGHQFGTRNSVTTLQSGTDSAIEVKQYGQAGLADLQQLSGTGNSIYMDQADASVAEVLVRQVGVTDSTVQIVQDNASDGAPAGGFITIDQQNGRNQMFDVGQYGRGTIGGRQVGEDNHAVSAQIDTTSGSLHTYQTGDRNFANARQTTGGANFASVVQGGPVASWGPPTDDNFAQVVQSGDDNWVDSRQFADQGVVFVEQDGAGGLIEIQQINGADRAAAYVKQSGTGLELTLMQTQADGVADVVQLGASNTIDLTQSGLAVDASISQDGANNSVTLTQAGAGALASITQGGSGNVFVGQQN